MSTYKELRPHGIMFHHFYDSKHLRVQGALSAEEFEDALKFIGLDRILSADEWTHKSLKKELKDSDICITFDDNLLCQYDIAFPVLKNYGIEPFWFIYTSPLDGVVERLELYRFFRNKYFDTMESFYQRFFETIGSSSYATAVEQKLREFDVSTYLSQFHFYSPLDKQFRFIRDQILSPKDYNFLMDSMIERSGLNIENLLNLLWMNEYQLKDLLDSGHVIGLHSHTHPTQLSVMDNHSQRNEYLENYKVLNEKLGIRPTTMSHPSNSYNLATLSILDDLGVQLGFRADMQLFKNERRLEFPREDHTNIMRLMRG